MATSRVFVAITCSFWAGVNDIETEMKNVKRDINVKTGVLLLKEYGNLH